MLWISYMLLMMVHSTHGKYVTGHLITRENWAFVARFCFLSEDGEFEYSVQYDEDSYGTINLLLYYDSDTQWPAVYKSNKTCLQKESVLKIGQNQVVNLTTSYLVSGCRAVSSGDSSRLSESQIKSPKTVSCRNSKKFRSSRERWWFFAFSNCNSIKGLNIRYRFLMTNGAPGDFWHEHLSADEFYILPVLLAFTLIYLLLIFIIFICTVELKARQFLHATYKLFIVSVSLQLVGIMAQCTSYLRYASDGIGYTRLMTIGKVAESASEICFLLLLLLLAKGYTVTRGRLRLASSVKMTIFMCLYVACYTCLFIYEREFFDPGEVLYLYESPAGYGLITLRIVAWWMFIYSTVFTLKHYPEKATFYYPFNIIGTLWFVAGPTIVLAANSLIDKWVRESLVCAAFHTIAFGGHVLFLILTLPSKANKNFPYHVRTNQIGMMEITGFSGNNSLYQFSHHPYAPGGPVANRDVPLELFTVSTNLGRRDIRDYESQAFPHQVPPNYPQTVFLPITLRNNSEETTPNSSGYNTPKTINEELNSRARTTDIPKREASLTGPKMEEEIPRDNSPVNCSNEEFNFKPSAPPEDEVKQPQTGTDSERNSRSETASTASVHTVTKNHEVQISIEKLTDMFTAQSQKKA